MNWILIELTLAPRGAALPDSETIFSYLFAALNMKYGPSPSYRVSVFVSSPCIVCLLMAVPLCLCSVEKGYQSGQKDLLYQAFTALCSFTAYIHRKATAAGMALQLQYWSLLWPLVHGLLLQPSTVRSTPLTSLGLHGRLTLDICATDGRIRWRCGRGSWTRCCC